MENVNYRAALEEMGTKAREASRKLAVVRGAQKNRALEAMADQIRQQEDRILEANKKDLEAGRKNGLSSALMDRLELGKKRLQKMAKGLETLVGLEDPIDRVEATWIRPNGMKIQKTRVPIGLIGIIYEARPNVTADAAGLCLKAGNCVFLRGGREAYYSNSTIAEVMKEGLRESRIPEEAIQFVPWTEREAVEELLHLEEYIDLIIPRGGESLIQKVAQSSTIPVIKHYKGVCHIYVDKESDQDMALKVIENAKCQRPGVCNAVETVLVHQDIAEDFLPKMAVQLREKNVELRGDEETCRICPDETVPATEEDWSTEYLELTLSVKGVESGEEAVQHINKYGTHHSDAIITSNRNTATFFADNVLAAAVYVNASTRFTDGAEFGMGAEIGISTDRIHARGPMGIEELTTYRYLIHGKGQIRT